MLKHTQMNFRRLIAGVAVLVPLALAGMPSALAQSASCAQIIRYHQIASEAEANYRNQFSSIENQIQQAKQQASKLVFRGDLLHAVVARQTAKDLERQLNRLKRKAHNSRVVMKKLDRRWHRLGCDIPARQAQEVYRQLPPQDAPMDAGTAIGIMSTFIGMGPGFGPRGGPRGPSGGFTHNHGHGGR
jgi:hypothetical protein